MSTTENNKLIAEFIKTYSYPKSEDKELLSVHLPEELKFHSSWDWLMPVYNKCMKSEQMRGDDEYRTLLIDAVIDADIEQLHKAVVEFIKWYNENK